MKTKSLSIFGRISILFFCCFCWIQQSVFAKQDRNTATWAAPVNAPVLSTPISIYDVKWDITTNGGTGIATPSCPNGGTYSGNGSQSPMTSLVTMPVNPNLPPSSISVPQYYNIGCKNTTTLRVIQQTAQAFHYRITLNANAFDVAGTKTSYPITLDVSYDNTAGIQYKEKDSYVINNGYYVVYCITAIETENLTNHTWSNLTTWPTSIALDAAVEVERYYSFDALTTTVNPYISNPSTAAPKIISGSDADIELQWNTIETAEFYDVEWVYVDKFLANGLLEHLLLGLEMLGYFIIPQQVRTMIM